MSDTHQSRLPDPVALTIAITNCGSQDPCTDSVIGAHVHTLSERLSVPTVAVMSSAYRERLNITEEEELSPMQTHGCGPWTTCLSRAYNALHLMYTLPQSRRAPMTRHPGMLRADRLIDLLENRISRDVEGQDAPADGRRSTSCPHFICSSERQVTLSSLLWTSRGVARTGVSIYLDVPYSSVSLYAYVIPRLWVLLSRIYSRYPLLVVLCTAVPCASGTPLLCNTMHQAGSVSSFSDQSEESSQEDTSTVSDVSRYV